MKILQIIQKPQLRGAEIFTCQVAVELIKKGHQVDVAYLFGNESFDLNFNLQFINLNGNRKNRIFDLKAYSKLASLIREKKYDFVQANSGDTLKYVVLSKLIFRWHQPLIYRNANKMTAFMKSRFHKIYNAFLLANTTYIISVSDHCRIDLNAFYSRAERKSITIPQATNDYEFTPKQQLSGNDDPIIINVGSFVPEKNHQFLLQVFKSYRVKYNKGILWLVGDGYLRKSLEKMVIELGLANHVKFWGYRKDVIGLLKQSNVLVMPSLIEGLPGVILESFSCGIPVVAAPVGGIPEAIENNVTGLCPASLDIDLYVSAIEKLNTDCLFRDEMVRRARQIFLERFTVSKVSEDFAKVYEGLLPLDVSFIKMPGK